MQATRVGAFGLLAAVLVSVAPTPARAQSDVDICYALSSPDTANNGDREEDQLSRVIRTDSNPATNQQGLGRTGTRRIEAMTFQTSNGTLYAVDGERFGTLDRNNGRFNQMGNEIGRGDGPRGDVTFNDIRGLAVDPTSGYLYATQRREGDDDDVLLRIDPNNGRFVANSFGNDDYAPIDTPNDGTRVEDIAIDQNGTLFAINSDDSRDTLLQVNKTNGSTTDVGTLGSNDLVGLSFANGQMVGLTARNDGDGGLWDVNKSTGGIGSRRQLDDADHYTALACLVPNGNGSSTTSTTYYDNNTTTGGNGDGRLAIRVDARPNRSETFVFSATGGPLSGNFDLRDNQTITWRDLPSGTYTIRQTSGTGNWPLDQLNCSDPTGGTTTNRDDRSVSVNLSGDEDVACEFINIRDGSGYSASSTNVAGAEASITRSSGSALADLPRTGVSHEQVMTMGGLFLVLVGLGLRFAVQRHLCPRQP